MYTELDVVLDAKEQKKTGTHYTPFILGEFVAKEILKHVNMHNINNLQVMDPSVGTGELLVAFKNVTERLTVNHSFFGFDTNSIAVEKCLKRLSEHSIDAIIENSDFLEYALDAFSPFREPSIWDNPTEHRQYDVVISNPPYVRTQQIGAELSQYYSKEFGISGRIDLLFPFLISISWVLKPDGVAGVIISNRFLTTKAGTDIREFIANNFEILAIYDFGDSGLFEAAVLPCVLILRKRKVKKQYSEMISIYKNRDEVPSNINCYENVFDAITQSGIVQVKNGETYKIEKGHFTSENYSEVWTLSNDETSEFERIVKANTEGVYSDYLKISVGIKTTADNVFIDADWGSMSKDELPELLQPLITHKVANRFFINDYGNLKQVLYTHHSMNGKKVAYDINEFPNTLKYLTKHRAQLEGRGYIAKAKRKWYEIWVPQNPLLWSKDKIVFRDISEQPVFWLDTSRAIVNGDCYWMTLKENVNNHDILYLALAVSNSTFIEKFYDISFNNKLYAGRRRFIAQYVEKFPLPFIGSDIAKKIIKKTKELCETKPLNTETSEKEIDGLVWEAFGFHSNKLGGSGI